MKYFKIMGIFAISLFFFIAGVFWQKQIILESKTVSLTEPLILQSDPSNLGTLPKGTVLYPFSSSPSTDTYIVFINTKNRNLLKPISFDKYMTVVPIDGYSE